MYRNGNGNVNCNVTGTCNTSSTAGNGNGRIADFTSMSQQNNAQNYASYSSSVGLVQDMLKPIASIRKDNYQSPDQQNQNQLTRQSALNNGQGMTYLHDNRLSFSMQHKEGNQYAPKINPNPNQQRKIDPVSYDNSGSGNFARPY